MQGTGPSIGPKELEARVRHEAGDVGIPSISKALNGQTPHTKVKCIGIT